MPGKDLQLTDAQGLALFKRIALAMGLHAQLLAAKRYASEMQIRVEECEPAGKLSDWNLTAGRRHLDTDAYGRVYGRIANVAGAGTRDIRLYKDSGRTVLVAKKDDAPNDTVVTLAPETGFLLAGTVKTGTLDAGGRGSGDRGGLRGNPGYGNLVFEMPIRRFDSANIGCYGHWTKVDSNLGWGRFRAKLEIRLEGSSAERERRGLLFL